MVESSFLSALGAYLTALPLTPKPKVGVAEPALVGDLPAVVLSLEQALRPSVGLGDQGALVKNGALEWSVEIDLASPYLPDDPGHTFPLIEDPRLVLTLPHGGLVHADGSDDVPLTGTDLQVTVAGVNRPVVSGAPTGLQVRPDAGRGVLTFATALPANGIVEVTYFLGQWERRVERLNGVLRLDVCAINGPDVQTVADGVLDALLDPRAKVGVPRLIAISLKSLGTVGLAETASANARRRSARLDFQFEHDVDRPESSGGVIRQITIDEHVGLPDE